MNRKIHYPFDLVILLMYKIANEQKICHPTPIELNKLSSTKDKPPRRKQIVTCFQFDENALPPAGSHLRIVCRLRDRVCPHDMIWRVSVSRSESWTGTTKLSRICPHPLIALFCLWVPSMIVLVLRVPLMGFISVTNVHQNSERW